MCPVGSIIMWGSATSVPTSWLVCDGTIYNNSQYQALSDVIGYNFGNPPPSTTWNPATQFFVPDLRGRFVRGVDDTASGTPRDPDRAYRTDMQGGQIIGSQVGSLQADEFASHNHSYTWLSQSGGIASGSYWAGGSNTTGNTGGNETRPKNAYVYFIIYAGSGS